MIAPPPPTHTHTHGLPQDLSDDDIIVDSDDDEDIGEDMFADEDLDLQTQYAHNSPAIHLPS